ncbi:unnamed protein product [Blepharisma stoltei]|uniref:Uncharacterized protein n=1 Tax=Blepharisma stoltei TaxID=1481888 RepID=A0AAU9JI99_9CILI|nr:unnamed protein product [Blepharisma stoltei]
MRVFQTAFKKFKQIIPSDSIDYARIVQLESFLFPKKRESFSSTYLQNFHNEFSKPKKQEKIMENLWFFRKCKCPNYCESSCEFGNGKSDW